MHMGNFDNIKNGIKNKTIAIENKIVVDISSLLFNKSHIYII